MRRISRLVFALIVGVFVFSSCYDDFVTNYEYPSMGFSLARQVRTVVSTTNKIYVGVSFGGSRTVDDSAWGQFSFDESLLNGTGLIMLPESYYVLDDLSYFRVRRSDFAVADVGITFTDAFYDDPKCLEKYYALPFRLVATSIHQNGVDNGKYGAIREGASTSVVAIKYISGFSGTYYKFGNESELDYDMEIIETTEYKDIDLSKNSTTTLVSVGKNSLRYTGLGAGDYGSMVLNIDYQKDKDVYDVQVIPDVGIDVSDVSAKYVAEGDYTLYNGELKAPQINLEYTYCSAGISYRVTETLVLRQYAEKELRVETF